VLPSFAEGLPVVIMEAMALGRPVISTYIAGIPGELRIAFLPPVWNAPKMKQLEPGAGPATSTDSPRSLSINSDSRKMTGSGELIDLPLMHF
jgi:hypothetical protein